MRTFPRLAILTLVIAILSSVCWGQASTSTPLSSTSVLEGRDVPTGSTSNTGVAQSLSTRAQDEDSSQTPSVDKVNASESVVSPTQIDVVLERLDLSGKSTEKVGEGIFIDDAKQTLSSVVAPEQTQIYLIRVKNTSQNQEPFRLNLGNLLPRTGVATSWNPVGWTAFATFNDGTANIAEQLQSERGYPASIAAGGEATVRLSITAPETTIPPVPAGSFRFAARSGSQSDVVLGELGSMFVTRVEWSSDNKMWTPVTSATVIQATQFDTICIRVHKSLARDLWPEPAPLGPKWTWWGDTYDGQEVWLATEKLTDAAGAPVLMQCGPTTLSLKIRVVKGKSLFEGINVP